MVLNIKEFVKEWKQEMSNSINKEVSLAIIQVGDIEASNRYVKNKLKDCAEVGIIGNLYKLDSNVSTQQICNLINNCSEDGIIVQLPLPSHIDVQRVTEAIPLEKDVDGFKSDSKFTPCTPGGILKYLKHINFNLDGANAAILGRSDIVGKPIAKLLLKENCTVSICHTHTKEDDKLLLLRNADLVICATGHRGSMTSRQAPNAFIIDVGINFDENNKLCGDVLIFPGDEHRVTPVPGGVGLLTRCMLLQNTIEASKWVQH